MFENGLFNVVIATAILIGIVSNAKIRQFRDAASYAPEILIAIYTLLLGTAIIFHTSLSHFIRIIHSNSTLLLFLPYACAVANSHGFSGESKKSSIKWLSIGLLLAVFFLFSNRADYNYGNATFISEALITIFFGLGILRFTGYQRIILLLAVMIWSAFQISGGVSLPAGLSFTIGVISFVRVGLLGKSTFFEKSGFHAQDIVDAGVHPFLILDLSGKIVLANNEFIGFSGYSQSEIDGKEAIELFEIPNNWMLKINPNEGFKKIRCHLLLKNGEKIPILMWLNEIRNNSRDLKGLICYFYDESEHQSMRDKLNEEARRFAGLHETSKALSSSLEMRDVLEAIADAAESLTNSETCSVFLLDHSRQMIKAIHSTDEVYSDEVMNFEFPVGQGLTGRAVGEGRPQMQNFDDEEDLAVLIPGTADDEESILSAPLLAKNVVIGALTLYKTGKKKFNEENLETLTVFASQAASALETSRLYMKLKDSEKVYRASVDLAGDGIIFIDSETGKITDANETMKSMLDYSRAEIVSKYIWELHPQPYMQVARQLWQSARNNGNDVLSEIEYETKNGKIIPASINASVIATGDINFIQWVVRDMSEYKRTINRMTFFHDIFLNLDEPVLITDSSGMVSFVNHAFKPYLSADFEASDYTGVSKISLRSLGLSVLEELWEQVKGKTGLTRQIAFNFERNNQVTKTVHISPKYDNDSNLTHYIWSFYPAEEIESQFKKISAEQL